MNKPIRFSVTLREQVYKQFRRFAAAEFLTVAQLTRYAIMEYMRGAPDATGLKDEGKNGFRRYRIAGLSTCRIRSSSKNGRIGDRTDSPRNDVCSKGYKAKNSSTESSKISTGKTGKKIAKKRAIVKDLPPWD